MTYLRIRIRWIPIHVSVSVPDSCAGAVAEAGAGATEAADGVVGTSAGAAVEAGIGAAATVASTYPGGS
jgi:hypothetical protein